MNIIFLDFDGVLRPHNYSDAIEKLWKENNDCKTKDQYGHYFSPWCLDALNYIIAAGDAHIVFTTDWRKNGFEQIRELWVQRGYRFPGKVFGQTPVLEKENRGHEISAWLKNYKKKITSYVILDDIEMLGKAHTGRHIWIDPKFGLTMSHAKCALQVLNEFKYKPLKEEHV